MLTRRVIPCLDIDAGRVVKGTSFVNLRDAGDPAELAAVYDREGADELVFLDITASSDGRETMIDVVRKVSSQVFIPLTVGGGLRSVEDMRRMLEAGADKVAVNTAAINRPALIEEGAREFGSQCIVLAMDVMRWANPVIVSRPAEEPLHAESPWGVYTHGGRRATALDPVKWARLAAGLGAGEILVTSMDADGQRAGYDLDLLAAVASAVAVPVIASGGAGRLEHLYDALVAGKADAVLAASIFHYRQFTIPEAKAYLAERGVPVRPPEEPRGGAGSPLPANAKSGR
ncbi:MAG: imidazole glycerol phosphate synthase subunit HisF [Chloroflexi bacterium]|nr:imidazole glycerol phosphate synthase subunit HisF [Chloroflexota bacterium]